MNSDSWWYSFVVAFRRECRRMTARRFYWVAALLLPLFAVGFMASVFGNGRMEPLPVGWVDEDESATSREIRSALEAIPSLQVAHVYADEWAARRAMERREVYGYLVVPFGYEFYTQTDAPRALRGYYHTAFLSVGGEVKRAFASLMQPLAVAPVVAQASAVGMSASAVSDFLQPVAEQVHPLFNPTLNYRLYLSYPFCFILLQVLLLLLTTYVLGIERKEGTAADWLRGAQGRVGAAVVGKLAPYWLLFAGVSLLAHVLFFGYLRLPTVTSPIWLWLGSLCFLASTQAVALCFYALLPVLGLVFSGVSMFGSLGATLSGVTFPLRSMPWPVEWASYLFPLRYFVELSQQWMTEGMEHWTEVLPLGALLLFLLPAWGLLPRLKKIYQSTS